MLSVLRVVTQVALAALLIAVQAGAAQTETALYSFGSQSGDGIYPSAGLVMDSKGNLYGTTSTGGSGGGVMGYGTVFRVAPDGTETVLYEFGSQSGDGNYPAAGLVRGKRGVLYGTTLKGGGSGCQGFGCGTVFMVDKRGKETVLYSFGSQSGDGANPQAGLVMDKEGNLYGTTYSGGAYGNDGGTGYGTVFKVTPAGAETVLYNFGGQSGDAAHPYAGLILDKKGNLYGTTTSGGATSNGTVFEITPAGTETVLYSFAPHFGDGDGWFPYGGLVMDAKGNLYGTTIGGVKHGGTVFKLTRVGKETVLYNFGSQSGDGDFPYAGLVKDKVGNLYGTTYDGGAIGAGTVFRITPSGTETVLYSFGSQSGDGEFLYGGLVMDKSGNLYGNTYQGGANGYGVVFKVTP